MSPNRRRLDVNLDELDRVLDGARETPLSEADCEKVKTALHALAAMLVGPRNTEKTNAVLPKSEDPGKDAGPQPDESSTPPAKGHGRNGAEAFSGAQKIEIQHQNLKHGDRCPDCGQGNVYGQKEPKMLVRVVGQAPLAATVYSLERLRCGACGQVFTAQEPEGVGPEKYDETATAMVAQLKYGSGVPFHRLEHLEAHLGVPLPATTQWEMVEEGAELIKPAQDENDPAGGAGRSAPQRRHRDEGAQNESRAKRQAHGHLHQRNRVDKRAAKDRAVLHRAPTRGGKSR